MVGLARGGVAGGGVAGLPGGGVAGGGVAGLPGGGVAGGGVDGGGVAGLPPGNLPSKMSSEDLEKLASTAPSLHLLSVSLRVEGGVVCTPA